MGKYIDFKDERSQKYLGCSSHYPTALYHNLPALFFFCAWREQHEICSRTTDHKIARHLFTYYGCTVYIDLIVTILLIAHLSQYTRLKPTCDKKIEIMGLVYIFNQ